MLAQSFRRVPLAALSPLLLGLVGCAPVYQLGQRPPLTQPLSSPLTPPLTPALTPPLTRQPLAPRQHAPLASSSPTGGPLPWPAMVPQSS
jgi:hypothetical protein